MINKKYLLLITVTLLFLFSASSALLAKKETQKPRFYFKINGMAAFSNAGHYGQYIDGTKAYYETLTTGSSSYEVTTTSQPFFRGFGGEIGLETSKHAVGVNIGMIEQTFDIDYRYRSAVGAETHTIRQNSFKALPIFLYLQYKVVSARAIKIFLTVGEGVYLTKFKETRATTYTQSALTHADSTLTAKRNHLGFHVGLSFDIVISKNFALNIDGGYRGVSFKDITANYIYQDDKTNRESKDTLYYRVEKNTSETLLSAGNSNRTEWLEVPAIFNLKGMSLTAGLKISL